MRGGSVTNTLLRIARSAMALAIRKFWAISTGAAASCPATTVGGRMQKPMAEIPTTRRWFDLEPEFSLLIVDEKSFGRILRTIDGKWRADFIDNPDERKFDDRAAAVAFVERCADAR